MPDLHQLGSWLGDILYRALDWLGGAALSLGLRVTGLWDQAISAWAPPQYAALILAPRYHTAPLLLLFVLFCLWLRIAVRPKRNAQARDGKNQDKPVFKGGTRIGLPLWKHVWWRIRPVRGTHLLKVHTGSSFQLAGWLPVIGGKTIAFPPLRISTKRKHRGTVGVTGSRKSSLEAQVVNGRRKTLILTGEPSDPLRWAVFKLLAQGKAVYWSPHYNCGWDMLQGDPVSLSERLTAGIKASANDTGLGRGFVQDLVNYTAQACDKAGVRRTWGDVLDVLAILSMPKDDDSFRAEIEELLGERPHLWVKWTNTRGKLVGPILTATALRRDLQAVGAAQRWAQRWEHMLEALGPAIGTDLNIAEALEAGKTVFMEMSSMRSPESTPLTAANVLLDAKGAAGKVRGVRLIVDEGWAFKDRKEELAELIRAGRRLGWEVVFLSQLPQDYSDEMLANFRVWVYLLQVGTNAAALDWCSKAVGKVLPPEAFAEGYLKEGYGWLQAEGHVVPVYVPWFSVEGLADAPPLLHQGGIEAGSDWVVPSDEVPSCRQAQGGTTNTNDGTKPRDYAERTRYELDGEWADWDRMEDLALPQPALPTPPGYYVREALLLKTWPKLSGTYDALGCWLVPKGQVNGKANRAKIYAPKGTKGWGETVEKEGCWVLGYIVACRARHGEAPPAEPDENGNVQPWTVDHVCHTEDLYCPGGDRCEHRRCLNGEHHEWSSPRQQYWRMKIHEMRREMLLAGEKDEWESTVCAAADEYIRNNPPAARRAASTRRVKTAGRSAG